MEQDLVAVQLQEGMLKLLEVVAVQDPQVWIMVEPVQVDRDQELEAEARVAMEETQVLAAKEPEVDLLQLEAMEAQQMDKEREVGAGMPAVLEARRVVKELAVVVVLHNLAVALQVAKEQVLAQGKPQEDKRVLMVGALVQGVQQ